MKVLVIGSGGREHALCQVINQSNLVHEIWIVPGNAGIMQNLGESKTGVPTKLRKANLNATDIDALVGFARTEEIDLTIVGPESSLELGVVDAFLKRGLTILGPTQYAAQLETSKSFAKEIMIQENIPTAKYFDFYSSVEAITFIEASEWEEMVVKCDGLAAGKGVVVAKNKDEAIQAVKDFMVTGILGFVTEHLIIEECLFGKEISAFALCDGTDFTYLGSAMDHKRLLNNDQGPNTGGMGVVSPAPGITKEEEEFICQKVFLPMVTGMHKRKHPFVGILFAGLIKTQSGIQVLEFNARLGDPETQCLLPLVNEDIVVWMLACAKGELAKLKQSLNRNSPILKNKKAVHVVMASYGYPGTLGYAIKSGDKITVDHKFKIDEEYLYFAGTALVGENLVTSGGRVLGVTSIGETYSDAREKTYEIIKNIHFEKAQYRTDIGQNL